MTDYRSAVALNTTSVGVTPARQSAGRDDTEPAQVDSDVIRFEGAGVRVGGRRIWRDVTFSARAGEFIAILGPNGAGKSTLLKVALGLLPLSAGHVSAFGRPVRRGSAEVSYLPQRRVFDSDTHIRGRDLVRLGLDGTRWGTPLPGLRALWGGARLAREERQRVQESLDLVGATAYADRPIGEISGGEQQRILIAQALVTRPRLLLLDEPLEGLDLPNQQAVSLLIQTICREAHVAALLVAHDVNPLLSYLDRVIYVAHEHVISGQPEEVITTEKLSRLYDAHIEVLRTSDGRLIVVGQPDEGISHHGHGR
jgi:zinc/manganese transport system ATP-binding protein